MPLPRDHDGHPLLDATAVAFGLKITLRQLQELARQHPGKLRRIRRAAHGEWLYRREDVERLAGERESLQGDDQAGTV